MKKLISIILILFIIINQSQALLSPEERAILTFGNNTCENIQEKDIPTILIPGILSLWYSEEGYGESYDIFTFKQNGYKIKDVFYKNEFTISIDGMYIEN